MLFLPRQPLETVDDLRAALDNAIKLELATIPPYLAAYFSIKPGCNAAAGAIIRSVVIEEMLHMTLACNLLNAVGGQPHLPKAVLRYPSELPMGIGDQPGQPFVVPLARLSEDTIRNFMTIEEPEHPLQFPDTAASIAPEYHTIGEFYQAVAQLITQLGPGIFTSDISRQVVAWIGTHFAHAVTDETTALAAIDLIVDQGEGTATSPQDGDELAHYYRFEQILKHKTLNPDASVPGGYSWGEPAVALDPDGVWPMVDNPPDVPLPPGSQVARVADQFDGTFTTLIDELQCTFNGQPHMFDSAVAQMQALRIEAQALMPLPVPGTEQTAGPRFLYRSSAAERD